MEGLVYKTQAYKESSRLIQVYTPQGKVTLIAKGAQKLNNSTRVMAQYLTHIHFKSVDNKTFYTLMEPKLINEFLDIKSHFRKTKYASLVLEIIDTLVIDHINHEWVFNEAKTALNETDVEVAALKFALRILTPLGVGLDLSPNGQTIKGVSVEKGGIVYENEPFSVDLETKDAIFLLKLNVLPYNEHSIYEIDTLKKIEQFIKLYYEYHLHMKLKALK